MSSVVNLFILGMLPLLLIVLLVFIVIYKRINNFIKLMETSEDTIDDKLSFELIKKDNSPPQ